MDWALFGYSDEEPYGVFLAERNTKEELKEVEEQARQKGFTKFSYSHFDGSMPDFSKTINTKRR